MPQFNQKGLIHLVLLLLILAGIGTGLYLVNFGSPLKLFSKAFTSWPVKPEVSFALADRNYCPAGLMCALQYFLPPQPQEEFNIMIYVRSDIEGANLFEAKTVFPKELVEVKEIKTEGSFVKNWVEQFYDNNSGEISLVGGVPAPGLKTETGKKEELMATIVFKAKTQGKGVISFKDSSAIYSNLNNINILTVKKPYDLLVEVVPLPKPTPDTATFEIGLEAGEQHDTGRVPLVAESGAKWVRLNFVGSDWLEGSSDVKKFNLIIDEYLKNNIKIIGLIGAQSVVGGYDRNDPAFAGKFSGTAGAIIARFGDRVKVFELFNEPNDWAGGSSAQMTEKSFAINLAKIFRKIKMVGGMDDISLISGPLFSFDLNNGAQYLQNTYNEGKALTGADNWETIKAESGSYPLDGIGYHIYVAQGTSDKQEVGRKVNSNLAAIESVIAGNDPTKKLWITEFGWGTGKDRVSEAGQAANLLTTFDIFKNDSYVRMAMWFTLSDFDGSEWGLVRGNGVKKQGWEAFMALNGKKISPSPTSVPSITKQSRLTGDINSDNTISLIDMSALLSFWNKTGKIEADLNIDDAVNTIDYSMMVKILIDNGVVRKLR